MKSDDAMEYLVEIMGETDSRLQELCDLLVWAYDTGWTDGLGDYHEERERYEK
jgi:hypothetical protein